MSKSYRLAVVAAAVTILYVVGLAFNITPWLRGPEEWRWAYAVPGTLSRLWLPAVLLVGYIGLVVLLLKRETLSGRQMGLLLLAAVLMTPALQLALLYMDHPDVRAPLFYRTVSSSSGGFFEVGVNAANIPEFLANFPEHMSRYPVHPQRHPPGIPLLFAAGRLLFDRMPATAGQISDVFRPYQCHNLPLMALPDSAIAGALVQMVVPLLLGLVVLPLHRLGREWYGETAALRAAALWPLIPSVALWATRWNHLYAFFTLASFLAVHYALERHRQRGFFLSGFIVSLASFFSFGNFALAGFLGIYGLIWLLAHRRPFEWGWYGQAAVLFVAGLGSIWLIAWLVLDLSLLSLWRTAMDVHLGLGRSYWTWLFFHLYDFLVFLGLPLAVLWLARLPRSFRAFSMKPDIPLLAFFVALVLLDLSGTSQGEVARVWAFLLPLALITAVGRMEQSRLLLPALLVLLAVQVFVSNIFLRPVGTGLSDPPAPPAEQAAGREGPAAVWAGGPVLQTITFPNQAAAGQQITIQSSWTTTEPIDKTYTVFYHLVDEAGIPAAQSDGMPLAGMWPTTCWRPNALFSDNVTLTVPAAGEEATYELRVGFYLLPAVEHLPLLSAPGDVVTVGTIGVGG